MSKHEDEVIELTRHLLKEITESNLPDIHLIFVAASVLATLEAATGYVFPNHILKNLRDGVRAARCREEEMSGVQ